MIYITLSILVWQFEYLALAIVPRQLSYFQTPSDTQSSSPQTRHVHVNQNREVAKKHRL
jgi:hypothetical protein